MKKIFTKIGLTLLVVISVLIFLEISAQFSPPPQLVANFTELDKIARISKFRSCVGHTTVPQNKQETKRSMKHYFQVKPSYLGSDTVKIFAPFDGLVTTIRQDPADGLEGEIWLVPQNIFTILPPFNRWSFSVQHLNVRAGLKSGSSVKAGELIGYGALSPSAKRDTFDVVYAKGAIFPKKIDGWMGPFLALDSVFNQMSPAVFSQYEKKGINSKDKIIISKNNRDQLPCTYQDHGPYFLGPDNPDDWVVLQN